MQVQISKKATQQIQKLGLAKPLENPKALFIANPLPPSLDFKPLKGVNKGFDAFRMNDQYWARFIKLDEHTYFIFDRWGLPLIPSCSFLLFARLDDAHCPKPQ